MKLVYTPKNSKNVVNTNNPQTYYCDAYEFFKQKRKDDLIEIVTEINRRESEKFHLPKL